MSLLTIDRKGILLIALTSILLGIWATVNTIALRNILLVFNTGLSVIYLWEWLKINNYSLINTRPRNASHLNWLPIAMIVTMFIWVILHYLLFSQFPEKQWAELTSTWLRAFMASVIGFGCALALRRNQSLAWLLWLGLTISFLILLYQYIPKAIAAGSLLATDWFGNYIYWAKYSGVLAGIILFAGTLGLSIDSTLKLFTGSSAKGKISSKYNTVALMLVCIFGLLLPIYAFVYVFSAKNGVGVAAILLIFWFVVGGFYLLINFFRKEWYQFSSRSRSWWGLSCLMIVAAFAWLGYQHVKNNPGWESLIEDIQIGVQVDKYPHWQNYSKHGFPKRADGSNVAGNSYDRTALIVVGLRLVSRDPIGIGISKALPVQMQQGGIDYYEHLYTHSAWIDLGLIFGWPGILLLPSALLAALLFCIKKNIDPQRATIASMAVAMLFLYFVGEYAFQHGIEILLFVCSLLAGLCWFHRNGSRIIN